MELTDRPAISHRPQVSEPNPSPSGQLAPWYLQHRDQAWQPFAPPAQPH
ncbi:hypothetical protein ACSZOL_11555 [Aeromonas hydrophila]|uniref:Uncharacterized protein n=1 Tax=Aeromonas hydrophila TaxID=644 RepID=A0AAX3P4L4_AERHY|nr:MULTISPECIES: hypothetical protein [Aeromonas]HDT5862969.1 hypothetical protein [Aeromonas hydrophila subsp. hydrophila]MCO4115351.1 hypothetical protein [Aeromonas hydrophila]MCV9383799.1 hypothetical protein [Aeromonas hydrophila]MDD9225840.1 hypothetical protein [Aeromonas hydrophila]WEA29829.1 hypothetical protein PWO56_21725 [Aeromonas hydrophila]